MRPFDTFAVVDWSAGKRGPAKPSKDSIWLGVERVGGSEEPLYCRSRFEAEERLSSLIDEERSAGRRLLLSFDFPFGYPRGFARHVTGQSDTLVLWDWLAERVEDAQDGRNNRYDVAEMMNFMFEGPGPFWGKPNERDWPGIPYRKVGIPFAPVGERRACDLKAKASSSCFQLAFPPTVGGQVLMGLPVLSRLRRRPGVAVWPFEISAQAPVVLAEIWPGLIEPAVKARMARLGKGAIRDREQVRLLARALSRVPSDELRQMMDDVPAGATEEGWILGAGNGARLTALTDIPATAPPPLRDDCFALPGGVDWTPADQALALLRARLHRVVGQEQVELSGALGRVLAAPVTALRANPPDPNSAVDGYGFAFASLGDGDQILPLVQGRAAAGVPYDGKVPAGHAIRVLTGAALPDGVDTVILQEDVNVGEGEIAFRAGIRPRANTRQAGEDVEMGESILAPGRVLTPADLALCAAVGGARLEVCLPLRVAIISTGDELAEAGHATRPGQIYDANRPMLSALVRDFGYEVVDLGKVPDDRDALRRALDRGAAEADVILTSGGASAGDEDHVSALLNEAGAMAEWRIAIKPGRPLALGLWRETPVFGLPGNPVAALVCALVFARPAMASLSGAGWFEPQGFDVPANFRKRKKPGRREYLRARMRDGRVEVFKSEGSGRISGLSWAEGLVELPEAGGEITPGDSVRYIPFASFLRG